MPAPFVNAGSDLASTHVAAAFRELCIKMQLAERDSTLSDPPNNITIDESFDDQTCSITATLPVTKQVSAAGSVETLATEYLSAAFEPGTSDLKSTSLPAAILEAGLLLMLAEQQIPEENRPDNISLSEDESTATISATLPIVQSLDSSGNSVAVAIDYIP